VVRQRVREADAAHANCAEQRTPVASILLARLGLISEDGQSEA